MALLKYLQQEGPVRECGTLWKKETEQVNECVKRVLVPSSTWENGRSSEKRLVPVTVQTIIPCTRKYSVQAAESFLGTSLQQRTGPLYCCFLSHMPALLLSGSNCPCKRDHDCSYQRCKPASLLIHSLSRVVRQIIIRFIVQ